MTETKSRTALVCPECGAPMAHRSAEAHALSHWPEILEVTRSSKEARERQKQTLDGGIPSSEYIARINREV